MFISGLVLQSQFLRGTLEMFASLVSFDSNTKLIVSKTQKSTISYQLCSLIVQKNIVWMMDIGCSSVVFEMLLIADASH